MKRGDWINIALSAVTSILVIFLFQLIVGGGLNLSPYFGEPLIPRPVASDLNAISCNADEDCEVNRVNLQGRGALAFGCSEEGCDYTTGLIRNRGTGTDAGLLIYGDRISFNSLTAFKESVLFQDHTVFQEDLYIEKGLVFSPSAYIYVPEYVVPDSESKYFCIDDYGHPFESTMPCNSNNLPEDCQEIDTTPPGFGVQEVTTEGVSLVATIAFNEGAKVDVLTIPGCGSVSDVPLSRFGSTIIDVPCDLTGQDCFSAVGSFVRWTDGVTKEATFDLESEVSQ